MTDLQGGKDPEVRLQRAADRLLELVGQLLEGMRPEQLDTRSVRSISSTLKDLEDLLGRKEEDTGKVTVALEGEVETYAE